METARSWRWASFALIAMISLGCSTVYFHNGGNSTATEGDQFHHIVAAGLVEVSDPVDLKEYCEGKDWETVKTELTFAAGLVTALVGPFYTPWGVAVGCRQ